MAGRVATATALGSRDCHHIEATAAPAQMHRSCSAPPLSNAGAERQASIERGMSARARGEKEHAVGAEGQSWGASGVAARRLERGDRGSVPASRTFAAASPKCLNVRPADANDADGEVPVASFGSCARANGWTKKSDVELVEALHETDNDEQ